MVDLVGEDDQQTAKKVAHRAIRVTDAGRQGTLVDILRVFGTEKAIVFTNTKNSCSELVNSIPALQGMAMPLHGDITQIKREATLKAYKENKFRVLVATDVAARGIDIPAVGVVIHYDVRPLRAHTPSDSSSSPVPSLASTTLFLCIGLAT